MQDDAKGVICYSHGHALHADCCSGLVEAAGQHLLEFQCPLCRQRRSSNPFLWPPPEWFENEEFSPSSTPPASPQPEPEPPQPEPHHQPTFPALTFRSKTPMAPEDIIQARCSAHRGHLLPHAYGHRLGVRFGLPMGGAFPSASRMISAHRTYDLGALYI